MPRHERESLDRNPFRSRASDDRLLHRNLDAECGKPQRPQYSWHMATPSAILETTHLESLLRWGTQTGIRRSLYTHHHE